MGKSSRRGFLAQAPAAVAVAAASASGTTARAEDASAKPTKKVESVGSSMDKVLKANVYL